ncbi:MAG: diacylglycerol/lipid kinase family protein [Acidobacteriota bacterium]
MSAVLILNPVAGEDAAPEYLTHILAKLSPRFGVVDVAITAKGGDASLAAREAVASGCEYLFIAGGDGTLNEALNGVAAVEAGFDRVTLGLLPLGTGNDFANAINIPAEPDAALDLLVTATARKFDVGRLDDRVFINVSAGGFVADVSDAVDSSLKSLAGRFAYLIGGAKVLLGAEPFECHVNGRARSCLMFAVCNAPMFGGGRLIAPDAAPDDGALDVCLVGAMSLLEFVGLLRRVASGSHVTDERVTYFAAREVDLAFDREVRVNTDGEVFSAASCHYGVLAGAARVLAP